MTPVARLTIVAPARNGLDRCAGWRAAGLGRTRRLRWGAVGSTIDAMKLVADKVVIGSDMEVVGRASRQSLDVLNLKLEAKSPAHDKSATKPTHHGELPDLLGEIAPELTGHGLPLIKCEAYNRGRCKSPSHQVAVHDRDCLMSSSMSRTAIAAANLFRLTAAAVR